MQLWRQTTALTFSSSSPSPLLPIQETPANALRRVAPPLTAPSPPPAKRLPAGSADFGYCTHVLVRIGASWRRFGAWGGPSRFVIIPSQGFYFVLCLSTFLHLFLSASPFAEQAARVPVAQTQALVSASWRKDHIVGPQLGPLVLQDTGRAIAVLFPTRRTGHSHSLAPRGDLSGSERATDYLSIVWPSRCSTIQTFPTRLITNTAAVLCIGLIASVLRGPRKRTFVKKLRCVTCHPGSLLKGDH